MLHQESKADCFKDNDKKKVEIKAKFYIEDISKLKEVLTGEGFKLTFKGTGTCPEDSQDFQLRYIFWTWILMNPDSSNEKFFQDLNTEVKSLKTKQDELNAKKEKLEQEIVKFKNDKEENEIKIQQNNQNNTTYQKLISQNEKINLDIVTNKEELNRLDKSIKGLQKSSKDIKIKQEIASKEYESIKSNLYKLRQELTKELQDLLNKWIFAEVTVTRNSPDVNNEKIINEQIFGIIAAARKLYLIWENSISHLVKSESKVLEFYKSKEWRDYIRERCGKLSVLGFSKNHYPLTEDFYVEPDFDNSNWDDLKNSISKSNSPARILITGQSGIGKTSLLKRIAILCYRQEICKGYLPVYISLRQGSFLENEFSPQSLWDIYMSNLSDMGVKITREKMIEVFLEGKALIIIDGLDFNHVNSWNHITQVRDFIQTFPNNSFVISSKELPPFVSDSIADKIFNIKGFDKEHSQKFIQKYFKIKEKDLSDEKISNLLTKYSDLPSSSDVQDCQDYIPLLLSCFCWEKLQDENENSSNNSHKIDDRINDELIPRVIDQLVKHWDDDRSSVLNDPYRILLPEQRIQLLGFLAVRFMEGVNKKGNRASVTVTKNESINWIIEFISTPEITKYYLDNLNILSLENSENIRKIALYLLNSIESQDGLIVERNPHVSFIHGSIQRYLAAKYLSNCGLREMDKYLELQGDWVSVVKQALQLINADFIKYSDHVANF